MNTTIVRADTISLEDALDRLDEILKEPLDGDGIVMDATIQRFKKAFECFWKHIQKGLKYHGIQTSRPSETFRFARSRDWLTDEGTWEIMLRDFHSHICSFDADSAMRLYTHIQIYAPKMRQTNLFLKPMMPSF